MHKDTPDPLDVDQLKKLKYETTDVSLPSLSKALIGLFIFIGASSFIAWGIMRLFIPVPADVATEKTVDSSSLAPGLPVLQAKPKFDMLKFRLQEEAKVDQYGWADKSKGRVHVPIDVAIEKMTASGVLPHAAPGGMEIPSAPKPTAENTPSGTLPMAPASVPISGLTPNSVPVAPTSTPADKSAR